MWPREGDVGGSASVLDGLQVRLGRVRLVGGHVTDREVLGSRGQRGPQVVRVVGAPAGQFHGGHDVRPNSGHGVELHPLPPGPLLAPLVVVPTDETAGGESGGVHGEIGLDALERQSRDFDQVRQDRGHFGSTQVAENRVEVRVGVGQTLRLVLPDVGVEATGGQPVVDPVDTPAKAMSLIGIRGRPRPCGGLGMVEHRSASMGRNRSFSSH